MLYVCCSTIRINVIDHAISTFFLIVVAISSYTWFIYSHIKQIPFNKSNIYIYIYECYKCKLLYNIFQYEITICLLTIIKKNSKNYEKTSYHFLFLIVIEVIHIKIYPIFPYNGLSFLFKISCSTLGRILAFAYI